MSNFFDGEKLTSWPVINCMQILWWMMIQHFGNLMRPSGRIHLGHVQWPLAGYNILFYSFEDKMQINLIYWYLIFKWGAWLESLFRVHLLMPNPEMGTNSVIPVIISRMTFFTFGTPTITCLICESAVCKYDHILILKRLRDFLRSCWLFELYHLDNNGGTNRWNSETIGWKGV